LNELFKCSNTRRILVFVMLIMISVIYMTIIEPESEHLYALVAVSALSMTTALIFALRIYDAECIHV